MLNENDSEIRRKTLESIADAKQQMSEFAVKEHNEILSSHKNLEEYVQMIHV